MADDFIPEPDAAEQRQEVVPEDDDEPDLDHDAPEADAIEQARRLPLDDDGLPVEDDRPG